MKRTLVAMSVVALMAGCSHQGDKAQDVANSDAQDEAHASAQAKPHGKPHWGYEGHEGPENWAALSEEFAVCGEGQAQSPVDIASAEKASLEPIEFHYQPNENARVVNNGHTIKVEYDNGSYANIRGKRYDLLQFHFHTPSEHTIDGKPADMVAHLVHQAADGELAVVAVLFEQGASNAALQPVWSVMPAHNGATNSAQAVDVAALLPADQGYYHYTGSLTTPPCSEGVNWNVLKAPVQASADQVGAFGTVFAKSVRPTQPLHGRMISEL